MMDDKSENQSPRWLIYAVTLLSGLALGLTLVFIAWNSALDENKREFSFESSKIRELITHNIQVSNDVINTVASLITENKGFDDQIFQSSAIGILEQQNYMEGLFYSHIQETGDSTTSEVELNVVNSRFRDSQMSVVAQDIIKNEDFENVLKFLLLDETSQAVVSVVTLDSNEYYILIKPLINKDYIAVNDESSTSLFQGVLCILINPETLVGYSSISNTLLVELHSESSNLSGRKLIFSSASSLEKRSGLLASSFSEDTSIQFPLYSVKLSLSKDVYWPDVNRKSIYIALFIGLGITLLLMALVRAKDIR